MPGPLSPVRLPRPLRHRLLLALSAVALVSPVAPASADTFTDVYKDFAKDGAVDPCRFSAKQLKTARDQITPDIEQYAPDFPAAVDLALEARTNGACKKAAPGGQKDAGAPAAVTPTDSGTSGGSGASTPGTAQPATPAATPGAVATPSAQTPQPAPAPSPAAAAADGAIQKAAGVEPTSGRSDDLPAAVVGLGTLAVLLALTALLWLALRALAWEPAWMPRTRHAVQEAGWRMSGTWSDFTDWVRLGR